MTLRGKSIAGWVATVAVGVVTYCELRAAFEHGRRVGRLEILIDQVNRERR